MTNHTSHPTIQLTQFIIENLSGSNVSQVAPLFHPDVIWIEPSENRHLKGCNQILAYLLHFSGTPDYRPSKFEFQLLPVSDSLFIVTGCYVAATNIHTEDSVSSKQSFSFVWQKNSYSFYAVHMHLTAPFKRYQKPHIISPLFFREKSGENYLLSPNEILYFEAENINCKLFTTNQCICVSQSMNQIEQIIPEYFIRIHRSFIINKNYIKRLRRYFVTLQNGCSLPVPEKKYMLVKEKILNN